MSVLIRSFLDLPEDSYLITLSYFGTIWYFISGMLLMANLGDVLIMSQFLHTLTIVVWGGLLLIIGALTVLYMKAEDRRVYEIEPDTSLHYRVRFILYSIVMTLGSGLIIPGMMISGLYSAWRDEVRVKRLKAEQARTLTTQKR